MMFEVMYGWYKNKYISGLDIGSHKNPKFYVWNVYFKNCDVSKAQRYTSSRSQKLVKQDTGCKMRTGIIIDMCLLHGTSIKMLKNNLME